jgi:hypothetical protein
VFFFRRYIPDHKVMTNGRMGAPHPVMWIKMSAESEMAGEEEFAIDYPGVGDLSFLRFYYDQGAEGQERLRRAQEVILQKQSEDSLAGKAISVRDTDIVASAVDEGDRATGSVIWANVDIVSTSEKDILNEKGDVIRRVIVKRVHCKIKDCTWLGNLIGGSTGAAVTHFKRVASRRGKGPMVRAHQNVVSELNDSSPNMYVAPDGTAHILLLQPEPQVERYSP